jgi:hypothetical protein
LQPVGAGAAALTICLDVRARTLLLGGGILAVAFLAGAGGVYAYDREGRERIAAGSPWRSCTWAASRSAPPAPSCAPPSSSRWTRPVRVRHEKRRFRLTPRQARLVVDVDDAAARALARSRDGSFLSRALRNLTGGRLDEDIEVRVRYSEHAVDRLVRRVRATLERPYRRLERVRSYRIAVGEAGRETPAGLYTIQNKAIDPAGDRSLSRLHPDGHP